MRWSRTLAATLIGAASACSLFGPDPDRLDRAFGRQQEEAGPPTAGPACTPARPPGKPDAAGGGAEGEFAVVFSTMALLEPTDTRAYDLDGKCTCPGLPSCAGPQSAACDLDGGIDNKLLGQLERLPGADTIIGPTQLPQHFANGEANVILLVTAYNGAADDDDVAVFFVRSPGTPRTGGVPAKPAFDGRDAFDCVSDDAAKCDPTAGVVASGVPQTGYVRDGFLVVPDASFVLSIFADSAIRGRGVLTAKIVSFNGAGFALQNGIIAGAIPIQDLVAALAQAGDGDGGTLCDTPGVVPLFKNQLCAARDSTFVPTADAAVNCDAVSTALSFEAKPFVPHAPVDLPDVVPCPAAQDVQCE